MHIESIVDHVDRIGTIAEWHWEEWGHLDPNGSLDAWAGSLRQRIHRGRIPTIFVALNGTELLGTAGLTEQDMDTHTELSPWLSGVYVKPEARGRGIGRALIQHTVQQAAAMGVARLYLHTYSARDMYLKLGWQVILEDDFLGERVSIMAIDLPPAPVTGVDPSGAADPAPQALPPWSAVIVNYNTGTETLRCLPALRAMRPPPVEIIVVDNASADNSLELLASEADICVIANAENLGFAGGANVGLGASTAPFVAAVNPDILMKPDWAAVLLRAFLADDRLGAAGGKLLYPDGKTIQAAGGILIPPRMRGENVGRGETDEGQYDREREVDFIPSSALMLRRSALDAVGLFDAERFFPAFYADAEICYRLRRNGWRVRYFPAAVALHEETMTRDPSNPRVRFLSYLQRLQFAMKHLDRRVLLDEFLPLEQEYFLEAETYAKSLELRCAEAERYAKSLKVGREEAETYARSLEQRALRAETYAKSLEAHLVEMQVRIEMLEHTVRIAGGGTAG